MFRKNAALIFLCIVCIVIMYAMTASVRKNAFNHMKMNQPIFRILNINLDDDSWDNHLDNV